jgi:flagellar basal-body rod modification protein FlgD
LSVAGSISPAGTRTAGDGTGPRSGRPGRLGRRWHLGGGSAITTPTTPVGVSGNVSDYVPRASPPNDAAKTDDKKDTPAKPGGDLGKDAFLKLLVAQLKYQDPMKPMDNTEFLAQTAQFTTVEKLADLATAQQSLLTAQLQLGASNLIGKTVAYIGQDGTEQSGVVTAAAFSGTSPTLRVGDTDVALSAVKEVRSPAS